MSCIYSNFEDGKCQLFDPDIECNGYDKNAFCMVEFDPCPYAFCEMFEPTDPGQEFDCED